MNILLLGCDGQVGWELQRSLSVLGSLTALNKTGRDGLCGNLADSDGLATTLRAVEPDVVVNAAAYTAVDDAETHTDLAMTINATAPGQLARLCAERDALLVHYSTDYVFDGSGTTPWREDDATAPINAYGSSKWAGEEAIRAAQGAHLIFRTQWVYAARGGNFMRTMLRLAATRDALTVIDDQHGAPTGADLIADVTAHAIARATRDRALCGTYHLAASGETTWYAYATRIIAAARAAGWPVKVASGQIRPVPSSAYTTPAARPGNSRLATERLQARFGLSLPHWTDGCLRTLNEILLQEQGERAA